MDDSKYFTGLEMSTLALLNVLDPTHATRKIVADPQTYQIFRERFIIKQTLRSADLVVKYKLIPQIIEMICNYCGSCSNWSDTDKSDLISFKLSAIVSRDSAK